MTYMPPFPIIQQPSIPMDPLKAARLREQALLKIKQTPVAGGKGDFGAPQEVAEGGKRDFQDLTEIEGVGPNAGVMPPLPTEDDAPAPAAAPKQPADTSEEEGGPTDLTRLGDKAATPVAAAADPIEQALGGDPTERRSGSFWDNPASSDALIAFGAAMLRAPNFNTGLADGAEAVTKALEPYKGPTQAEIQRAVMNAKLKRYASGVDVPDATKISLTGAETGYDANGQTWHSFIDSSKGRRVFQGENGEILDHAPPGYTPRQDDQKGDEAKLIAKSNMSAQQSALQASQRIGDLERLVSIYDSSGAGPGLVNELNRMFVTAYGKDWGDTKISSLNEFEQLVTRGQLLEAQGQRGLGQLTEGERALIAQAWPTIATDKRAFLQVVNTLKAAKQREIETFRRWKAEKKGRGNFNDFYMDEINRLNDEARAKTKPPPASTDAPTAEEDPDAKYY
jgi:hypothetical protein